MSEVEIYRAQRGAEAAPEGAIGLAVSPYTIEVRFLGGLSDNQKKAFRAAADRWTRVIVGDLPSFRVNGETIDDLVIEAQGSDIDGPGKVLGQAGPTHVRPATATMGAAAFLPVKGVMTFDRADLASMEQRGTLGDVITHEMGHVVGVGTIWRLKELIRGSGTNNPTFSGRRAMEEFGRLRNSAPTRVPVENTGGPGTAEGHWRETVFRNELMSGFISAAGNPLSRVTAGSLEDMGYVVDLTAAEPFVFPNLLELAEAGLLTPPTDAGIMIPSIPVVLPE